MQGVYKKNMLNSFTFILGYINGLKYEKWPKNKPKQAGAELCQAQAKLGLAKLAFSLLED